MVSVLKQKYAPILCTAVFVFAIIISALIGSIAVSSDAYVTLAPDYASLSLYRAISRLTSAASVSSSQMLVIFLAGTSLFVLPISLFVAAVRGVYFGYAASVIAQERVSFSKGGSLSLFGVAHIPSAVVALSMHFITSVIMLLFMSSAISFADKMRRSLCDSTSLMKRYVVLFFVLSGACALCDIIKSLLI